MPYFFIVPVYGLFLLMLLVVAFIAFLKAEWRSAVIYILFSTLGSLTGFIVLNAVFLVMLMIFADLAKGWSIPGFAMLPVLVGGPVIASGLGAIGGFAVGFFLVFIWKNRRTLWK